VLAANRHIIQAPVDGWRQVLPKLTEESAEYPAIQRLQNRINRGIWAAFETLLLVNKTPFKATYLNLNTTKIELLGMPPWANALPNWRNCSPVRATSWLAEK
jgi:hypothetical protein